MNDLLKFTIADALAALRAKKISSAELTEAYLAASEQHKELNAYVVVSQDIARAQAKAADARYAAGTAKGFDGIPVAIKDLFCTKGVQTTAGSKMLKGFVPPYESTVTEKLFASGGVMLGKVNMDEFAMGSANLTSHFGTVKNPWKRSNDPATELAPGGSSGGSAAAVAANLCMAATGSDTGGSIRQPAAFTGIVGIKPTYGRCSRYGMVAFASSLDQAGVFTRTVKDAALMLERISGFDPKDSTSANLPVPAWASSIRGDMKGKKIGIPKEYVSDGMSAEIKILWERGAEWLKAQGAEIVEISLPLTKYALPTYYIIAPAEASSNLSRYDGVRFGYRTAEKVTSLDDMYERTRGEGFGHEVKRRIMIGTYVLSAGYYDAYYRKAQKIRTLIAREFEAAFQKVDAILTPATPTPAFALGEKQDPLTMYLNDVFTVPANLAGIPGIVVPAGLDAQGLPLGLQVLAKPFDEQTLFDVGQALETAADFKARPKGFV